MKFERKYVRLCSKLLTDRSKEMPDRTNFKVELEIM